MKGGGDIGGTESIISTIPITDSVVLKELKEADEEACKIALIIDSMKKSILNLQKVDFDICRIHLFSLLV